MKRIIKTTVAIAASFLAGYATASYLQKDLASSISLSAGGALFGGGVTWFYFDTKLNRQRNQLQSRIDGLKKKLETSKLTEGLLVKEKSSLQTHIEDLAERLARIVAESLTTEDKLNVSANTNSSLRQEIFEAKTEINNLKIQLENAISQRDEFIQKAEFKEAELVSFEKEFSNKVKEETDKNIKVEVEKETDRQFELLEESERIIADMDKLMNEVYQRHQSQRHYTLGITDKFLGFKEESDARNQQAYDDLLGVNQTLENQIHLLNTQLSNGLIQPVYKDYGIASLEGRVINGLIEWVYRHLQIPLRGLEFEENDGVTSFGVDYPKRSNPKDICQQILANTHNLKGYLGIHSLDRAEYIAKYDAIVISYRHTAPKPESDDDIYKSGLIPASQFADVVYKTIDCENSKAKPTMRIMAATGEGKGIAMKNLLVGLTEKEVEIWLSDPTDGDDFDYWDCPKIARSEKEAGTAYAHFVKTHKQRTGTKNNTRLIAVFDEFDKKHDDDDKESAKNLMTDIRHTNMVQILIGQAAEVGANKWTWDDMKNCSLLVLGDSIGTLCKHLVKDFGWTTKRANEVKAKKERFENWAEAKNTPDISNENAYRIGLLINSGTYQFVEIPSAYKGIVKSGKGIIKESLTATAVEPSQIKVKTQIKCPHCASVAVKQNGKTAKGEQYYTCLECDSKPKRWRLTNSNS